MKSLLLFLCLFCLITVITAILEEEGGKKRKFYSSSSVEDHEVRKKKKHRHSRPPVQGNGHEHGGGNGGEGNGNGGGRACPSDWMTFDRPQGRWCVKNPIFSLFSSHFFLFFPKMKPSSLFLVFLLWITVTQAHRKTPKDGRHLVFLSSSSSTSSEEASGKGSRIGEDTSGQSPRTDDESVNESEEESIPSNWGKRPHDSDSEDSEEEEWSSEEETKSRPPPKSCPTDWMTFNRPKGDWCVKLFVGRLQQIGAETKCREMNATLTGLQTDAERLKLAEAGRTIMLQNNYGDAAIWLGAHRKGSCPTAHMCFPKETFFWLDNHTTGTDGFGWATEQPDAGHFGAWGVQSCAHQFIFSSGTTNARWPGIIHGQLDDQYCQEGLYNPNVKMYACGKKPF
ncbi:hypothetical protein CAEBREN_12344 [Caenorhabditis brenneri]|uniref:C-type lectin domain-containing protein n=1 Tax=Caenorhabditis brenneri TaxID=135651 RepID=G0PAT5_CAEBE|nr:hypothetical protein CAEBREN_12344 [Caenorhabditis brenneri]